MTALASFRGLEELHISAMPVPNDDLAIPWLQICIGRDSQTAADYGVYGVPMYYVIGPDGRIVFSDHESADTIEAAVEKALSKK